MNAAVGDAQFQKKCLGKMERPGEGRTILFRESQHGCHFATVLYLRVVG